MISLIVPCYNSASYIDAHVEKLLAFLGRFPQFEIILVDDGSSDDTPHMLAGWNQRDARVVAVLLGKNLGKGAAVKNGVERSSGDIILFTDADLPYDLSAIPKFVQAIEGGVDVVLGTREIVPGCEIMGQRTHRTGLSRVFAFLANFVLLERVPDTQCGIKGFTRAAAMTIVKELTILRFCFDVEAILVAQQKRMKITSLPVLLVNQSVSSVSVGRDGIEMLFDLVKIFFRRRLFL